MRITNGYFGSSMLHAMDKSNDKISDVMAQISSGSRIQRVSDDPITSVRLLLLQRDQTALDQYRKNISSMGLRLGQDESRLDGMLNSVNASKDLMLKASNSAGGQDLNAYATNLRDLLKTIEADVNAKDADGNYLLSGTATDQLAITYDPTQPAGQRYSFTGNTDRQQVVIGEGITESGNISANELEHVLNQLDKVIELMSDPNVNPNDQATKDALSACIGALDQGITDLTGKIADVGSRQRTLETIDDTHANVSVANQQAMQTLAELDYAQAYDRLNNYQLAAQGSYQIYAKIMQLQPFNIILS